MCRSIIFWLIHLCQDLKQHTKRLRVVIDWYLGHDDPFLDFRLLQLLFTTVLQFQLKQGYKIGETKMWMEKGVGIQACNIIYTNTYRFYKKTSWSISLTDLLKIYLLGTHTHYHISYDSLLFDGHFLRCSLFLDMIY